MNKNKLITIVAIAQIMFFIIWYFIENKKLTNPQSQEILIRNLPIEQEDYLNDKYPTLIYYKISDINNFEDNKKFDKSKKTEIFAVLKKDQSLYIPDYVSIDKPSVRSDQIAIKGIYDPLNFQIEYGIEKYFTKENTKELNFDQKIDVLLIIDENYSAKIKSILIDGTELKN